MSRDSSAKRQFCAYLRVSDEAGREGSTFHSPEDQRNAIQRLRAAVALGDFPASQDRRHAHSARAARPSRASSCRSRADTTFTKRT